MFYQYQKRPADFDIMTYEFERNDYTNQMQFSVRWVRMKILHGDKYLPTGWLAEIFILDIDRGPNHVWLLIRSSLDIRRQLVTNI